CNPAAERERQQQYDAERRVPASENRFRYRVVRRLLMLLQCDGIRERLRYAFAVGTHVPDLAPVEPEAQDKTQREEREEQPGESVHVYSNSWLERGGMAGA